MFVFCVGPRVRISHTANESFKLGTLEDGGSHLLQDLDGLPESPLDKLLRDFTKVIFAARQISIPRSLRIFFCFL